MKDETVDSPDAARSGLRTVVATVDREIARLAGETAQAGDPAANKVLADSWAKLVALLALGPEPQVRSCPACKHTVMRAATLCGYCWAKLPSADRKPKKRKKAAGDTKAVPST